MRKIIHFNEGQRRVLMYAKHESQNNGQKEQCQYYPIKNNRLVETQSYKATSRDIVLLHYKCCQRINVNNFSCFFLILYIIHSFLRLCLNCNRKITLKLKSDQNSLFQILFLADNTLPHPQLSLILLRKNNRVFNQDLQCKSWLELVFLGGKIREKWG